MREIHVSDITETVARLSQEANYYLPEDVLDALKKARREEEAPRAQKVLDMILRNSEIAEEKQIALCQDTGTTVLFLEIGQDVHLVGGNLHEALADGVRQGYKEGFLRNSIVKQPFSARINTGDNSPPIVHTDIVPGEGLKVTILPKGGGCENMSRLAILRPRRWQEGRHRLHHARHRGVRRKPLPSPDRWRGDRRHSRARHAPGEEVPAAQGRGASSRPGGRRPGGGAAGAGQRQRHRPTGLGRTLDSPGREHRDASHAHHIAPRGGQPPVPQRKTQDGGAVERGKSR